MIKIRGLSELEPKPALLAIRDIFFVSSARQTFSSPEEKIEFFDKWTRYYITEEPDLIFLAVEDDAKVLGYLMGSSDSKAALPYYEERLKSYAVFADQFEKYPGHLHINFRPEARGQGIGSKLIDHFCKELVRRDVRGVHIVTGADAENRRFYSKNKFDFELKRRWREVELLFMGRDLSISST
ncbi:MAG: N-acetyltransferase family protein [Pseudobdellovibrionaceae bacterium]